MTEQEAIARLREKLTEADEWDESMAIVESADLRTLLESHERLREALSKRQWDGKDDGGRFCNSCFASQSSKGHVTGCEIREALEGKQ